MFFRYQTKFILLLFGGLLALLPGMTQEYSYARYDVKDGLAGSVVYCGAEDKEGFLWFGTETGVSRFDGTHFKNFTKADGLPDNEIIKLFVDSKGRVWMMPFRGSICYYWKGKIHNQENDTLLKKIQISGQIMDIVEDSRNNLLIMDYRTLHFISSSQEVKMVKDIEGISFFNNKCGLSPGGDFITAILLDRIGLHLVTFNAQAIVLEKEVVPYWPTMYQSSFLSRGLQIFRERDSLVILRYPGPVKTHVPLPPGFTGISMIGDSLCTINTADGVAFYNIRKEAITRRALKGKIINNVFLDSEGCYWFLTGGTGIFRIGSFEFSNYTFSLDNKNDLPVFSLYKTGSLLYAGSEKSMLWAIDLNGKQAKQHYAINISINTRITAIAELPKKRIMLGTDEGVVELNRTEQNRESCLAIKSLHVDQDRLLASTSQGICLVSGDFEYSPLMNMVRSTCSYKQGNTYYDGTLNGMYTVDSDRRVTFLGDKEPLFKNRIAAIEGAADSTLWVATQGDGLIGYKNGKIIWSIRQKDGLTSDICRNVFIAGKDVWVGTDRGLNRIQLDGRQYRITTFTSANGLMADIINAIYVDSNRVYVGTPAGLTSFDANKISLNSYCKLRVTDIQTPGKQWAADSPKFVLPHDQNAIRVDYVGISYRSAGDITYRYRLIGLSTAWQTTRETFLNYPSLPSGDYELQLTAINKFGVESEMLRLPFSIEKLLWEKNWFRILVLVIIWAIIWIFVNARIKRVRQQNDQKMQISNRMTELEQMALKAQMNPHFIFNSLNSLQQYVIEKDVVGANKFITDFSRLIRLTLDISSRTRINIYEEISYITTYLELEKTKFEDKFTYEVATPDINPSDWHIPPMILQPYVENSIRHGVRNRKDTLGHIAVTVTADNEYLICIVEDNGVGRQVAAQHKSQMPIEYQSKGMTLTAKRVEMLNKAHDTPILIYIEDLYNGVQPAGTRVILKFPLQDAAQSI